MGIWMHHYSRNTSSGGVEFEGKCGMAEPFEPV